jgi:enoyl-CoA hydratase
VDGGVRVEREGPVSVVTIDRPARRNAVDGPAAAALAGAFREFDGDQAASMAVLTGAGGAFCAGADLKAIAAGQPPRVAEDGDGPMGPTRLRLSKPVIAAIEGPAVAGGLELALWCDLRVAAEGAVLGVFCRRLGVPLMDLGTVRLPRLIGHGRAMDLLLTGREVGAAEALAIGLVDRVVPDGSAKRRAVELAGGWPRCRRRVCATTGCPRSSSGASRSRRRWPTSSAAVWPRWRQGRRWRAPAASPPARAATAARSARRRRRSRRVRTYGADLASSAEG